MNLSRFLKENKEQAETTTYKLDFFKGDEKPELVLKPITTKENNALVRACTHEKQVVGKPGQFTEEVDKVKYASMLAAACVVEPDLYSAELQDSYGVSKPEDLIVEIFDSPGEWGKFFEVINKINGFDKNINDDIKTAKN